MQKMFEAYVMHRNQHSRVPWEAGVTQAYGGVSPDSGEGYRLATGQENVAEVRVGGDHLEFF